MDMTSQLGIMGDANHMGFFSTVILGGLAGWIAGMITGMRHGILTNILIGVAGSFVGSELAQIAQVVPHGSLGHLLSAIVGAIVVTIIWRMLRGRQQA